MALNDTGQRVPTENGINAKATDGEGNTVVIETTDEAVKDFGWSMIFSVASKKYLAGQLKSHGPPPLVRVTTTDFY